MPDTARTKDKASSFTLKPIDPFGVEIDIDLRDPLDADQQAELRRLRLEHQLLVFRKQKLSMDEQERVMRSFGPIITDRTDRLEYVSRDHPEGQLGEGVLTFHLDTLFTAEPLHGLALHAIDVDDGKTATNFISNRDAYRALSDRLKEKLFGMQAVHCLAPDPEGCARTQNPPVFFPRALHQVVKTHPESGEPLLWVTEQQTENVAGLPQKESDELLAVLFDYLYAPENRYDHHWQTGDLVIWDNWALQHARLKAPDCRRTLQRATGGTHALFQLNPHLRGKLW